MSMRRRLKILEERTMPRREVRQVQLHHSDARRRMMEHLRLVARLRRGELGPEEAAEVESLNAAFEDRLARIRGEGSLLG